MFFLSIIIPVYNVEKYIKRTIESVISQSFQNWELILVDDGSTDMSGAICDDYADNDDRIRVFHKTNGGVSSARNMGLEHANGQWCCFVDSDDWLENTYLDNFIFEGIDDTQLVMQSFVKHYEKTNTSKSIILPEKTFEDSCSVVMFLENYPGVHNGLIWHRLFRLDIIRKHKCLFPEGVSFAEDGWFFFEYMRYVKLTTTSSKVGYNYLIRSCSLTSMGRKYPFNIYHDLLVHYVSTLLSYEVPGARKKEYVNFVRKYACRLWSGWYIDIALNRCDECNNILNDLDELNRKYHLYDVKDLPFFYERMQVWIMVHCHGFLRTTMLKISVFLKKNEMAVRRRLFGVYIMVVSILFFPLL